MRKKAWILIGIFLALQLPAALEDSLSVIRKINHHHALHQTEMMLFQLEQLDTSGDSQERQRFVARILEGYGDYYRDKGDASISEAFYKKSLNVDKNGWKPLNKLSDSHARGNGMPIHLPSTMRQIPRLLRNFIPSFLLLNETLHSLTIAFCWMFLVVALVLLTRYFPLAQNDLFRDEEWRINWIVLLLSAVLLTWPLVIGPGWGVVPFLIMGFLWVYMERPERRSILIAMIAFLLVVLLAGFQQVLNNSYQSREFSKTMRVFNGEDLDEKELVGLDNRLTVIRGFNEYEAGNMEKALEILESTGEEFRLKLKYQLLAGIQYRYGNISECIASLRLALQMDDKDPVSLNNFTLALLENGNYELLKSYTQRYPQIRILKRQYLQLMEPVPNPMILWRRLFSHGKDSFSIGDFMKKWSSAVAGFPGSWSIMLFVFYLLLIPRVFSGIGKSISCTKCGKHIDRTAMHRSYKLCNECYQLFMIKDVMFLEAKVIKEKELIRRRRRFKSLVLGLSLFIPGLNLLERSRFTLFMILATPMFFLTAFYFTSRQAFKTTFGVVPLFLQIVGVLAVLAYILVNLAALRGEEDGI